LSKKIVFTFAALLLTAAACAFGALGTVVGSYPIPGGGQAGLGIGTYLYVDNYSSSQITVADPITGSAVTSFANAGATNTRGLAYSSGPYLWQCKAYSSPFLLYRTNPANGSIYNSYSTLSGTCHGSAPLATGDAGAGTTAIFVSDYSADRIYVYNATTGSITSSFSIAAAATMYDIAYDWRNEIIWGGMNGATIHGVTTAGSLVTSFTGPWSGAYGIDYSGQYLYIAYISGNVFRVHCPMNLAVEPTSVGKVKALFR
jgi:hypothetical protein